MHPRIVMMAMVNVGTDLLCLLAAAAVLLTNNIWLDEVGPARFWFVVMLIAIGLVPVMYAFERDSVARRIGAQAEKIAATPTLPAWAGVDRTVRAEPLRA